MGVVGIGTVWSCGGSPALSIPTSCTSWCHWLYVATNSLYWSMLIWGDVGRGTCADSMANRAEGWDMEKALYVQISGYVPRLYLTQDWMQWIVGCNDQLTKVLVKYDFNGFRSMCKWVKDRLRSLSMGCHLLQHVESWSECANGDTGMTTPSNAQYTCNIGIMTWQ